MTHKQARKRRAVRRKLARIAYRISITVYAKPDHVREVTKMIPSGMAYACDVPNGERMYGCAFCTCKDTDKRRLRINHDRGYLLEQTCLLYGCGRKWSYPFFYDTVEEMEAELKRVGGFLE